MRQGNFHDWVELHNAGRKPLSLGGYALTDGNNTWMLPSMELAADGYLVVFWRRRGENGAPRQSQAEGRGRGNPGH